MTEQNEAPKLFISYSWSSQDHEAWVLDFASALVEKGIHVILDKWDLQPGHDANAFMESMVTDATVTKVLMICDEVYSKKSDKRLGGVGTEAQIITPELYEKTAQDKFVAVVTERDQDGKPWLPTYFKSRVYIDFSNAATYATEFEKVVRWAWGLRMHERPQVGPKPEFASIGPSSTGARSLVQRQTVEAIRANNPAADTHLRNYLDSIVATLSDFRLKCTEENVQVFDDEVVNSISSFKPFRDELLEVALTVALHSNDNRFAETFHRFLEKCLRYYQAMGGEHQSYQWELDNYKFVVHEIFLYIVGAFLKFEKYELASYFLDNEYYCSFHNNPENNMHSFGAFREYLRSLDYRNSRLKLGRTSIRADLIKERNSGCSIDFHYVMAADFVMYLRSFKSGDPWWPETLLYVGRYGGAFEMFSRAKSERYFEKLKRFIGAESKDEFLVFLNEVVKDPDVPKWQFDRLNVKALAGAANLASTP